MKKTRATVSRHRTPKTIKGTTSHRKNTPEIDIVKELTFIDEDFEDINPDDTELSKINFNL